MLVNCQDCQQALRGMKRIAVDFEVVAVALERTGLARQMRLRRYDRIAVIGGGYAEQMPTVRTRSTTPNASAVLLYQL